MSIDAVLEIHPGRADPRRFSLPITIARIEIVGGRIVRPRIVALDVAPPRPSARP